MTEFNDREEATIMSGEEDGDTFKKVVRVEATDDDGEEFDYVALKTGQVREATTRDGEPALVEMVEESKSLTSPDYIEEFAMALSELNQQIN